MAGTLTAGLAAHVDAGKTTLSEAMLFLSGAVRRQGRVDHGDAFLDTERMEDVHAFCARFLPILDRAARENADPSLGGVAALLSMLNSCASGVSVVNIDNGFGAGYLAGMINHMGRKNK